MNKYLEQLVNLSEIDKQIDSYVPRLEAISKNLNAKKDQIAKIDEQIIAIDTEITEIKAQISSTNIHIAEFNTKIKEISKKSSSVKTEKEIKALNLEEELAKDQLEAANEEIIRLERIIDTKNITRDDLQKQKTEFLAQLETLQEGTSQEKQTIEQERAVIYKQKEELLAKINQKVLTFYEKIRKWAKNTAVVPVKKQACYGCFMRINDKTLLNVQKSDDIVTCPHCGRIIYSEKSNQEEDLAAAKAPSPKKADKETKKSSVKTSEKSAKSATKTAAKSTASKTSTTKASSKTAKSSTATKTASKSTKPATKSSAKSTAKPAKAKPAKATSSKKPAAKKPASKTAKK